MPRARFNKIRHYVNMIRRTAFLRVPNGAALRYLSAAALRSEHPLSLLLALNARLTPETPAIRWRRSGSFVTRTYAELDERVNRVAHVLRGLGAGPESAVAAILPNQPEFVETSYACARLGVRFTPIGTRLKERVLRHIFADSGAGVLVTDADHLKTLPADVASQITVLVIGEPSPTPVLPKELPDSMLAHSYDWEVSRSRVSYPPRLPSGQDEVVMYTSGTTGKPKGARRNVRSSGPFELLQVVDAFDFNRHQRLYLCTPLYHAAPWAFCNMALSLGATVVLADRWHGLDSLTDLNEERVTALLMVPTLIRRWLDLPEPQRSMLHPTHLSKVISAGARFPARWKKEATRELGEMFYDFYGATEIGIISVSKPEDTRLRPDSVGRPMAYVDLRLVDEQGREVLPGERGELYARGQNFTGYFGNERATREQSSGGYFSVGDIAILDHDGYLSIVDRKADMIVSGGVNIYPAEIEAVIREMSQVSDVAVVGCPDEEFGEAVHGFVVLREGAECSEEDVIAVCVRELARYKRPRGVTFLEDLPRSPQGKVQKTLLQDRLES